MDAGASGRHRPSASDGYAENLLFFPGGVRSHNQNSIPLQHIHMDGKYFASMLIVSITGRFPTVECRDMLRKAALGYSR